MSEGDHFLLPPAVRKVHIEHDRGSGMIEELTAVVLYLIQLQAKSIDNPMTFHWFD